MKYARIRLCSLSDEEEEYYIDVQTTFRVGEKRPNWPLNTFLHDLNTLQTELKGENNTNTITSL